MWQKIKTFFETNPGLHAVLLHGLLIVGFMTVVFVAVEVCEGLAREYADRWEKDLSSISCNGDGSSELFPLPRGVGTGPQSAGKAAAAGESRLARTADEEMGRLRGQYQEIRTRMNHHLSVLKMFYVTFYTTILMSGGLAAIAAIMLLFIAMDGWKSSNPYARNLFLIATVSATFCAAFPSLFQQQRNIDENTRLYLEYVALTNEMCSYTTTGGASDETNIERKDFIRNVDRQLKALNKIAVGFDVSKVPDFTSALQKASGTSQTGGSAAVPAAKQASPKPPRQQSKP